MKYLVPILGVLIGGIAGYTFWHEVGCASGTCMITSKPLNSTIYGAVMGYLIFEIGNDFFKKK